MYVLLTAAKALERWTPCQRNRNLPPVQVISAVNGPALALQTKLVTAAKEAGTIKQFMPSEFSAFGAIGEETLKAT